MPYTDEIRSSNAGQGFGVAGFVIGIIALILSFIPCLGMYAVLPGVIAIIFSAVGYSQASTANAPKGMIIAALVISILGTSVASWQFVTIRRAATKLERFGEGFPDVFRDEIGDEIRENVRRAIEKIEDFEDHDTIPFDSLFFDSEEMIEELERLEGERPEDQIPEP